MEMSALHDFVGSVLRDLGPLWSNLSWSGGLVILVLVLSSWHEKHRSSSKSKVDANISFFVRVLDFFLLGNKPTPKEREAILKARNGTTANGNSSSSSSSSSAQKTDYVSILISFLGLQASFLTWGWVQERLMTVQYGPNPEDKFPSSNMLVFSNRVFAIVFSYLVIQLWYGGSVGMKRAPFVSFAFPSVANTVSSFAAYESLRFMSFPMSTVCKTLKIIPTMLVGTMVHRRVYSLKEYSSALLITLGAALFAAEFGAGGVEALFSNTTMSNGDLKLIIPGLILMATYLTVDAFTSNLQTLLFQDYLLTPYECMFGINLFSIGLTLMNLINTGELLPAIAFLYAYPTSLVDLTMLALSSASGQLFIYYTIERHGPIVFTIIQLTRQLLAILLSSWSFGHVVNARAWFGIFMLFSGMFAMSVSGKSSSAKSKAS